MNQSPTEKVEPTNLNSLKPNTQIIQKTTKKLASRNQKYVKKSLLFPMSFRGQPLTPCAQPLVQNLIERGSPSTQHKKPHRGSPNTQQQKPHRGSPNTQQQKPHRGSPNTTATETS